MLALEDITAKAEGLAEGQPTLADGNRIVALMTYLLQLARRSRARLPPRRKYPQSIGMGERRAHVRLQMFRRRGAIGARVCPAAARVGRGTGEIRQRRSPTQSRRGASCSR